MTLCLQFSLYMRQIKQAFLKIKKLVDCQSAIHLRAFKMATLTPIPRSKPMMIGESPHWIEKDQALVYVDITGGNVYRHFAESGRLQQMKPVDIGTGTSVSPIIPIEGTEDEFVIGLGRTLAWIKWPISSADYCTQKPVHICSMDGEDNRVNDGKCDPAGRLWAGTMPYKKEGVNTPREKGALYRIGPDLTLALQISKVSISNGLAWSADQKTFFYIDSLNYSVDAYDYDVSSGNIANRRVLIDYKKAGLKDDLPDGLCIDASDNLWVASFCGAKIICVDSTTGKILRKIDIPSLNVTSCCWGGKDYTTLYVTSAVAFLPKEEFQKRPETGKTFAITGLGVKGVPPVNFKMNPEQLDKLRNQL